MLSLVAALFLTAVGMSQPPEPAVASAPDRVALVSAMPEGVESVFAADVTSLGDETGALLDVSDMLARVARRADEQLSPQEITRVVGDAIGQAKPLTVVWAGWEFTMPRGLGAGPFQDLMAVTTEGELDELAARLARPGGYADPEPAPLVEGAAVYAGRVARRWDDDDRRALGKGEPRMDVRYVAIIDRHTVVTSSSKEVLEAFLGNLRDGKASVPEQWKEVAVADDLAAPLFIARRCDPKNERDGMSPVNPKRRPDNRVERLSYALSLPDTSKRELTLRVAAEDSREALSLMKREYFHGLYFRLGEPEEGNEHWTSKVTYGEDEWRSERALTLLVLFGINVAI